MPSAATGLSNEQVAAKLNRMIDRQACTMAVTDGFCMSSLLFFAPIAVAWFAKPKPGGAVGGGGAH